MPAIINTKIGENKGKKRVWLEGRKLEREGYQPGQKFDLEMQESKLVLKIREAGRYTVSKRTRNGVTTPIIDLKCSELEAFDANNDAIKLYLLRVVVSKGTIIIATHHQQVRLNQRFNRLIKKLVAGENLDVCSLFHGGGVFDSAIHHGLLDAGVQSQVSVAVEIEPKYLDSSLMNNPELWGDSSVVIESPIQSVNLMNNAPEADMVVGGIPCTGASRAGRSKNRLEYAESHDEAGALFFHFLQFIQAINPAVVVLENVPEYANTASMEVIRSLLKSDGYQLHEKVLCGNEYGALEKRKRLCMVALSKGLEKVIFDFDLVKPVREKERCLNDILEPLSPTSERWKSFDYLAEKEVRDKKAGKGFSRQLLEGSEGYCGTIGRHYAKCRSTEPFILHPENKCLSRILTPTEHARVKGIPEHLIAGQSDTIAHQILGQSVVYPVFQAVARYLGSSLMKFTSLNYAITPVRVDVIDDVGTGSVAQKEAYLNKEGFLWVVGDDPIAEVLENGLVFVTVQVVSGCYKLRVKNFANDKKTALYILIE